MKRLLNFVVLTLAASTGFYLGWMYSKKRYENLADDEVASIKKMMEDRYGTKDIPAKEKSVKAVEDTTKKDIPVGVVKTSIKELKKKEGYKDYAKQYQGEASDKRIPGSPDNDMVIIAEGVRPDKPYIITPEDFSESNFESITLFYYADKVLADDDYNVILNIEELIGEGSLESFGMYEDDSVHVRNDILGIDYEILLDERYFGKISPRPIPGIDNDYSD